MRPEPQPTGRGVVVRAAGGVVWRLAGGGVEVLLVHRPRYDDWTIPKGKAELGEALVDTAAREVIEETGLRCALGPEIGGVEYVDRRGRPKLVRYWAMTVLVGSTTPFTPNAEVDEVVWLSLDAAAARLSYPRDRQVLAGLVDLQGA